jgi:hypothetical protein
LTKAQRNAANRRKEKLVLKNITTQRLRSIILPDNSNIVKDYGAPYNEELVHTASKTERLGAKYYKERAIDIASNIAKARDIARLPKKRVDK